jgi:basic amino acid/polyamine antiporter, APA family
MRSRRARPIGILNAQLLSGPRLVYGMAADGRFFARFARLSPMGTPAAAVVLMAVLALVLLVAAGPAGVDVLLNGVMTIDGLFLGMTGAAVVILRGRAPRDGSFRSPLFPLFPVVFVLGELGVVVGTFLNPDVRRSAYIAAIWVTAAAALYFVRFRRAR